MSSTGLQKTLTKLRRSIADGNLYEAHQMYRTVSNRFVKQKNYSDAKAIVYMGAKELLGAGQVGSGMDLSMLLLELYKESSTPVHDETVLPLLQLYRSFPDTNASGGAAQQPQNQFMEAIIKWSQKCGWYEDGDSVLHHEYGTALLASGNYTEAEHQFILGTDESARQLASMLDRWCRAETTDDQQYSFATVLVYATRALLKLLVARRSDQAAECLRVFCCTHSSELTVLDTIIPSDNGVGDRQIFQHPLANFMNLLVWVVSKQQPDAFKAVRKRYGELLKRVYPESSSLLDEIGKLYFGIMPQTPAGQMNLNSLLGAMFGGGGGSGLQG